MRLYRGCLGIEKINLQVVRFARFVLRLQDQMMANVEAASIVIMDLGLNRPCLHESTQPRLKLHSFEEPASTSAVKH